MRVLIVDDDETFCQLLAEVLQNKGMQVVWTTDGLEGYDMSTQQVYDIFIVDVRMPLILGTELAEALKRTIPMQRSSWFPPSPIGPCSGSPNVSMSRFYLNPSVRRIWLKQWSAPWAAPLNQPVRIPMINTTPTRPDVSRCDRRRGPLTAGLPVST